ncbi:hypothetical protein UlMin_029388, partial [Ulmus minor]
MKSTCIISQLELRAMVRTIRMVGVSTIRLKVSNMKYLAPKVDLIGAGPQISIVRRSVANDLSHDTWSKGRVDPTEDGTYDKVRNALALALCPVVKAFVSFSDWFLSKGGTRASIQRIWDPVAYALGFIDCDNISSRCMLTIFSLFGSPDVYLSGPIRKYIVDRGGRFHLRWGCREILFDKSADGETYATNKKIVKADAYVAACDVPGIKRLLPKQWRASQFFNNIYELVGVPVVTEQLRYIGWVTELQLRQAVGLDNLLYHPDVDFSCFADLALTSPEDHYYIEGQGSLL